MNFLNSIRSGAAKLLQGTKTLANDVVLPNKLTTAKFELYRLESKLLKLEQSSDVFTTRTGQRVESREVSALRNELDTKRAEVAKLSQQIEARSTQVRESHLDLVRNLR